ncbi:MAG: FtsX-like permease family protein [Bacilli bacterium]
MKTLLKECLISIKKSFKRFLSILLIILLGVGFFAGIKATSPDMQKTLDKYYHDSNFYDIFLSSTWGITDSDIAYLKEKGYDAKGSYSFDTIIKSQTEEAVKIHSYDSNNEVNKLELVDGIYPTNDSQCVVEETLNHKIGDKLIVENDLLKNKELTIVGIVKSPIYISKDRGTTTLLSGKINYYLYVPITNFNSKYYTEVSLKTDKENSVFSKKYEDNITKSKNDLEIITTILSDKRYNETIAQLNEAKQDTSKIEKPQWYILDINSNIGFYQYDQDITRIASIAKVFPLVFFIVAILICLTSMTRMVEEERSQLGTLKSLGYSSFSIMFKYIFYALFATIIGSIIGVTIGFQIIPRLIFNMYSMMYSVNELIVGFNFKYALIGSIIAILCTLLATIIACFKELKEVPASLMRPKAPKNGKRVLLERVSFIWKHLSFIKKVTIRNVFRYKKRFLMTIVGIAGCTGLIIAGFGLKDCIMGMVPNQYDDVFSYQVEVSLKDDLTLETKDNAINMLKENADIYDLLLVHKEAVKLNNTNQDVILIVPFGEMDNFIKLQNRKSHKQFVLNDEVIVSEKLTKLLDLKLNDTLTFKGQEDYYFKIGGITENYLFHYIYMSKEQYKKDDYNTVFLKTAAMTKEEEKVFASTLKENTAVSSFTFTSTIREVFDSSMANFGSVSLVLIISAGLLAFVVLYNLASVNISERKRELASIKVLGFYDKEVYKYVNRETVILTILGIIVGLFLGKFLTIYILKTCELDMLMFNSIISYKSYLLAALITLVFTFLVNITTYIALKKIDMIEALKSVE